MSSGLIGLVDSRPEHAHLAARGQSLHRRSEG